MITLLLLAACRAPVAELPAALPPVPEDAVAFAPQYPLWTDGADKRRFISLPEPVDASRGWVFPVGTRIWKEFAFGRPVETRYMERVADGSWRFGTYLHGEDGAALAPDGALVDLGDGRLHEVPSTADCLLCHEADAPVLGFSALQLSADRDPNAPHAEAAGADLAALVEAGLVVGVRDTAPRIDGSPTERAARGYLHGNCGGCHAAEGDLAALGMDLRDPGAVLDTTVGRPSRAPLPGDPAAPRVRVVPGDPDASVLLGRMRSREPLHQMPPLGTRVVDDEAVALIAEWITEMNTRRNP